MKKVLSLLFVLCIGMTSFAEKQTPPWDKPLVKSAFDDPYVTYYYGEIIGTFNSPNYALKLTIQFNKSIPVPYVAIIQVFGVWNSQPPNASFKEYNIYLNSGNWQKTLTIPMSPSEEAYTGVMDLLYYGPQ